MDVKKVLELIKKWGHTLEFKEEYDGPPGPEYARAKCWEELESAINELAGNKQKISAERINMLMDLIDKNEKAMEDLLNGIKKKRL